MELPPFGQRPARISVQRNTPSHLSPAEERASQAESEANRRVANAAAQVEDAKREADHSLDDIRDQYERKEVDEHNLLEGAITKEKLKGYEELRDLRRNQQSEINRLRREGEREKATLDNYYRDTNYQTQRDGDQKFRDITMTQAKELEYERKSREMDVEMSRDVSSRQATDIRETSQAKTEALNEEAKAQYEKLKENTVESRQRAEQSFNEKFVHQTEDQTRQLANIENRASESLREIRRDTADKLAAYSSRQKDPFYKLQDLDADVREDSDEYVLTATIPEHEQQHVSVSVKGDQIVLSGQRRNEEKLDLSPGHSRGTNTFQSFQETFPVVSTVDASRMTRTFEGDQLTVRIPKKKTFAYRSEIKPPPERARVERPKFPENIPLGKVKEASNDEPPSASLNKKGSGPLS